MFIIRKLDKEKDMPVLDAWCRDWKKEKFLPWYLPEENFIIDDIIFASLYQTDSGLAYMENVLSNIRCPSKIRQIGLGKLGEHVFSRAKELGFRAVLGWTNNKSVSKVSAEHGFTMTDFNNACMVRVL